MHNPEKKINLFDGRVCCYSSEWKSKGMDTKQTPLASSRNVRCVYSASLYARFKKTDWPIKSRLTDTQNDCDAEQSPPFHRYMLHITYMYADARGERQQATAKPTDDTPAI